MCKNGEISEAVGGYGGILGITLKADTLSSVFIILTAFIFLIASVYSINDGHSRLFWFLLFVWEGLLIGIFLTRDLFNVFVLLEVATVVVSVLIMFNRDKRSMYDGMLYLMVNTAAVQFFLFGAGYIYKLTGTFDIGAAALSMQNTDRFSSILPYALMMTAVSLKCALAPLFGWLPRSHGTPGAPSSVSAILSGLHIKSALYLFIRTQSLFPEIPSRGVFLAIGIATGIIGFVLALSQKDIKLILAYHTISQIGLIMIGLNAADDYSYTGGIYHITNHAFFKSALFLCAGVIIDVYGTRDTGQIRGVLKRVPAVGAATVMAVLGITGAPFFNGSVSKYFIMSGTNWAVSGAVILINLGTVVSFIKYSAILFGEPPPPVPGAARVKIDLFKQAAVLALGVLCLVGGVFGEQFIKFLFNISVSVDRAGYLQKIVFFAASAAAGYFIYKYYVKTSGHFKRIQKTELSFRGTCVSIGVFFAIILILTWSIMYL